MPVGIAHAFNRKKSEPLDEQNLWLSYRCSTSGQWFLEWRRTATSPKPVAIRKARDVEVALISQILLLEAALVSPDAPRPMQGLISLGQRLRPMQPKPPKRPD